MAMDERQAYLEFFGLREQPFAPTADPAYFYAAQCHKDCLFRLWSSIDDRMGIAVVIGNYGTGKTTLLRKLLTGMAADTERYCVAVIGSPIPSWTSFALLESIVAQFGLSPQEQSFVSHMEALNQFLLQNRRRICTLIIDDAQNLNKRGQLELLRLVQNLETQQYKLLNLVFFAQLEWIEVLRAAPNFEQRISTTSILEPIGYEEFCQLVEFRLFQAGVTQGLGPEFEAAALHAIHAYAEGNPRMIVTICRNTLLAAAQLRTRQITPEIVMHTIEKTTLPDPGRRARAAAAVRESMPRAVIPPQAPNPVPVTIDRTGMTRDQRAAQMLLRASKERQNQGAGRP